MNHSRFSRCVQGGQGVQGGQVGQIIRGTGQGVQANQDAQGAQDV